MKWESQRIQPLAFRLVGSSNASTAAFVKSDRVPTNELWLLDFVSLYNQSGESLTVQWVILQGATVIFISADLTVADGDATADTYLPVLREGEEFAARVTGAANLGKVTMVLSGARLPEPSFAPPAPPAS